MKRFRYDNQFGYTQDPSGEWCIMHIEEYNSISERIERNSGSDDVFTMEREFSIPFPFGK